MQWLNLNFCYNYLVNQFDIIVFRFLNGFAGKSPITDRIFIFLADYLPYVLGLVFLILLFRTSMNLRWRLIITTAVSAFFARFIITEIIRFLYHRPRPFSVWHVTQLVSENKWSFPSGHAVFFFAVAASIYIYNKKWGILFYIAAFLISVARVVAGVHYPTDIIGGAIIGILCAYLVYFLQSRLSNPLNSKQNQAPSK